MLGSRRVVMDSTLDWRSRGWRFSQPFFQKSVLKNNQYQEMFWIQDMAYIHLAMDYEYLQLRPTVRGKSRKYNSFKVKND